MIRLIKQFLWKIYISSLDGERTALASYPRSGNTWLRLLIEKSTGEYAGSIYKDKVFTRNKRGIVIKTHQLDTYKYNKAIIVIRNPIEAINSYYHWKKDINNETILNIDDFIFNSINDWKSHVNKWMSVNYSKLIIYYEDIVEDPSHELTKVLQFIGRHVDQKKIDMALNESTKKQLQDNDESSNLGKKFFRLDKDKNKISKLKFNHNHKLLLKDSVKEINSKFNDIIQYKYIS